MYVIFLAGRSFRFFSFHGYGQRRCFLSSCLFIRCLVDNLHRGLLEDTYKGLSVDFSLYFVTPMREWVLYFMCRGQLDSS